LEQIFGNTIAKRLLSWNKMTQLLQIRVSRFSETFCHGDHHSRLLKVSESLFPKLPPLQTSRVKKRSLSFRGRFALPMKKRCWRP
jgi:hypothetical protein